MQIKEVWIKFANARKAVFNHPVAPADIDFAMTRFCACPPDSIEEHSTQGGGVRGSVWFSAEKMLEVIRRRWRNIELLVDGSDLSMNC